MLIQAISRYLLGLLLFSAFLFIPAGTINYWNGWLLMGILFIPMFITGVILMTKNPDLLRKRLKTKEKESQQKSVLSFAALMFICGFAVAGLDYRYGWMVLPKWVSIVAAVIFEFGYLMYAKVLRENTYLSRTVEVQKNQKVIDTGLYGIVRHPIYLSTFLLFLSMPLVLGSLVAFVVFLIYPIIIGKRIKNEEEVLEKELPGYIEYKKRIRYRVIPFIW